MSTKDPGTDAMNINGLRSALSRAQNSDGGWGFNSGGVSWIEPTAYALLALTPAEDSVVNAGVRWLQSMQRGDGGWRPTARVDDSTWVTSVAMLALARADKLASGDRSVRWLLDQTGRESLWHVRLRHLLLGLRQDHSSDDSGWPWFPGGASWVVPTAMSILALKQLKLRGNTSAHERILEGERFVLSRVCSDGGWNHGSSRALGYEATSYPETTGVALLAVAGSGSRELPNSLACARKHLAACCSRTGICWLQLGLLAHGANGAELRQLVAAAARPPRDVQDLALALLAERAMGGTNVFLH
jgi:hypothetical protein